MKLKRYFLFFMFVFGVNFNLYYLMLLRRFKIAFKSEELRVFLAIVAICTVVMGINAAEYYGNFGVAIRKAFFQTTATISTTGFGGGNPCAFVYRRLRRFDRRRTEIKPYYYDVQNAPKGIPPPCTSARGNYHKI